MPSRPIAFARSVIMVFLHALHTLFARWEDHVAVFSCFIAWLIPPWLVARLMSWTCMAIGIITIGAAVPVMRCATTLRQTHTWDFEMTEAWARRNFLFRCLRCSCIVYWTSPVTAQFHCSQLRHL